jgi:RNA polymerase sigma factor (TIGR02999 family)
MTDESPSDVTALLVQWSGGDEQALEALMPLVYDELRRVASRHLRRERPDHTLQTTALVHEAYLRLVDQRRVEWRNGVHFVALAAQLMRRILIDHARKRRQAKRGGHDAAKVPLDALGEVPAEPPADLLKLDEALTRLSDTDPQLGKIAELRFFGGLQNKDIAEVLGVSIPTVTRRSRMAKAWLRRCLTGELENGP